MLQIVWGDTVKLPVTVTIYSAAEEGNLPKIMLSTYLVNTPVGKSLDLAALVEQVNYRNDIYRRGEDGDFYNGEYDADGNPEKYSADNIQIDENIDWNTPGVYEVKVTFTDKTANLSNFARCYIEVY